MKTILITGAAGSLGQAVVDRLLRDGHTLEISLAPHESEQIFERVELTSSQLDLFDPNATFSWIGEVLQRRPRVHCAVLIAGGFAMGNLYQSSPEEIQHQFQLNFFTAYHVVQPLMNHYRKSGGGQFIFIGARPALQPEVAKDMLGYSLSKSLLFRLAEAINAEGKDKNIQANIIVPSVMDTPGNRASMPGSDFHQWVPTERVAETIAFVLSEAGRMMREPIYKIYHKS